jgi:hypothetical protein
MTIKSYAPFLLALATVSGQAFAKKASVDPSWLAKAKSDCIARVVTDYGVTADKVTLGKNRDDAKRLLYIPGKVNKGAEGVKAFMCKYNTDGALVDVMSMTSDGAL